WLYGPSLTVGVVFALSFCGCVTTVKTRSLLPSSKTTPKIEAESDPVLVDQDLNEDLSLLRKELSELQEAFVDSENRASELEKKTAEVLELMLDRIEKLERNQAQIKSPDVLP
ncbi:MAG: hypothetical protein KDD53_09345, partial [Bdellovibrionales bacterium]|nr:hypothetical protein [Bdellovibrionales bacterium]